MEAKNGHQSMILILTMVLLFPMLPSQRRLEGVHAICIYVVAQEGYAFLFFPRWFVKIGENVQLMRNVSDELTITPYATVSKAIKAIHKRKTRWRRAQMAADVHGGEDEVV